MSLAALYGPVLTLLLVGMLANLAANLVVMPRLRPNQRPFGSRKSVSILVPARNEVATIGRCLEALLDQDHEDYEVIVVDDRSDDGTADVVRTYEGRGVRLLVGDPLPPGWTGKNWACHQLAQAARGDVMCFVDADTVAAPAAVSAALAVLHQDEAGLVTVLLSADHTTTGESLLLPMVNHALMALFPVWLMHRPVYPRIALALGPFMMVTREAYTEVGGHAAAPAHIVDDVGLCRSVKAAGYPVRLANGTELVRTRWYSSVGGIWRGFSKNAFGALDQNVLLAAATVFLLVPLLCAPFVRVAGGLLTGTVPGEALAQVALMLGARAITSIVGRDPMWTVPTHPLAVTFWGAALAWSMILSVTNRTVEWRGRAVPVRSRKG